MEKNISIPTLKRLPNYYNIVCNALENGDKYISSAVIAGKLNIDDTQVRKDIAAIGYVGKPKVGFDVKDFKVHLESFLDFDTPKKAFLIGAGNLGIALAKYEGFSKYGLKIAAVFDNDPLKVGLKIGDNEILSIHELPRLVNELNVQMAILTVPGNFAQEVTDFLIKSNIKAIWSFAPINLNVPDDVLIWSQDLAANFITFSQLVSQKQQNSGTV